MSALDVDGQPGDDLVFTSLLTSGGAFVVLSEGGGTFAPAASLAGFTRVTRVESADLDGNGAPDLLGTNAFGGHAMVALGLGDGTFAPTQPLLFTATVASPFGPPTVVDLDGDGRPDLAAPVTGGDVIVLRNAGVP
ncbi:MAG: VCBS repeat-containing protein [Planctomycetes bacterium]|nr:VCBS repeat-containing protein [Planctomycetota bacterium]